MFVLEEVSMDVNIWRELKYILYKCMLLFRFKIVIRYHFLCLLMLYSSQSITKATTAQALFSYSFLIYSLCTSDQQWH